MKVKYKKPKKPKVKVHTKAIRLLFLQRDLTHKIVAKELGVSQPYISQTINGRRANTDFLDCLAKYLKVRPLDIYTLK